MVLHIVAGGKQARTPLVEHIEVVLRTQEPRRVRTEMASVRRGLEVRWRLAPWGMRLLQPSSLRVCVGHASSMEHGRIAVGELCTCVAVPGQSMASADALELDVYIFFSRRFFGCFGAVWWQHINNMSMTSLTTRNTQDREVKDDTSKDQKIDSSDRSDQESVYSESESE